MTPGYNRAATVENAVTGLRNTGIWPVNKHIFKEHGFVVSENLLQNDLDPEIADPGNYSAETPSLNQSLEGISTANHAIKSKFLLYKILYRHIHIFLQVAQKK